jgi:acetylglutamate kinase
MTRPRVYKVGGPALEDPGLVAPLAEDIRRGGAPTVLVHGGGRDIERMLRAMGVESQFVEGRRSTSPAAMEVVEMVLSGVVNKSLAAGLTAAGLPAVGVSGRDARLIEARPVAGIGRVGVPHAVNVSVLRALWDAGLLPVVSPVAGGASGESLNVNADEAALAIAIAVNAATLVYLSDVDGVRAGETVLASLDEGQAQKHIDDGTISGGMSLKVRAALAAARAGVDEVVVAGKARLTGGFPGTTVTAARAGKATA